jgi:hypothetical protein
MKRLVLLGEGHGEVSALPILINKLLEEKGATRSLYLDRDVIRTGFSSLVKWDKTKKQPDYSIWLSRVALATGRREVGGVLAVYDGDIPQFPAGSESAFCPATAAKSMAEAAKASGAGKLFSLAVVFACPEYETWLVAGAESFAGRQLSDGRVLLPKDVNIPTSDFESRGKRWLEKHCEGYRETRDQAMLTELLDVDILRGKNLKSFTRLEHAIDQLLEATEKSQYVATPF